MSQLDIKSAFIARLKTMAVSLPTVTENEVFPNKPQSGEPYQVVVFRFADTQSPTITDGEEGGHSREMGYMQVALFYPQGVGSGAADSRAEAIRARFPRRLSVTSNGVTATVQSKPSIRSGQNEGDRYVVRVNIPFFANIMGA